MCFGYVDRERPAIARRIPVEFVIIVEEPKLARRVIPKDVAVLADIDETIRIAKLDPDPPVDCFSVCRNGCSVEGRALQGETDTDLPPVRRDVSCRKIAEDA